MNNTNDDPASPTPQVKLYTTLGCHLCDQAGDLLTQAGMVVQPVEIADDDTLFERYAELIPVVARIGETRTDVELRWPFDLAQLAAWRASFD